MRGAAMSLTAAASGFVVVLLSVSVVQGQDGWRVTYTATEICALKGSTVEMSCTYTYPATIYSSVRETFWFTKWSNNDFVDLRTDSEYLGRVQYICDSKCTLRITDLRESDSAEYRFRFITNHATGKYFGRPGVTLSVTALQVQINTLKVYKSYNQAELTCQSSCRLPGHRRYIWYKNGQNIQGQTSKSYSGHFDPADRYSCAVEGYEKSRSPPVYVPRVEPVSVSPSGEIVENSSVTLTCSSDANPAAKYTWYKKDGGPDLHPLSKERQLVFRSIQSSDSGEYYCTMRHLMYLSKYISLDVKYAPRLPSVSVSPSAEIVENSSVTLTCSSDANPAAKYTWYKEKQKLPQRSTGIYHFTSISSEDRGNYYCKSENQYGQIMSSSLPVDVQYPPKLPSVSVSPSAEIVENSSVNLTCSSDANPAAKYTWYKENEDSPKASGQIFTITDFRPEHRGNYYCEAQNRRGRHNSTLHLIVVAASMGAGGKASAAGTIAVVLLAILSLSVFLWIRKKRASEESPEAEERPGNREQARIRQLEEQGDLQYASIHFSNNQADSLYSNIRAAQRLRHMEQQDVSEYAAVKINSARTAPRTRGQKTEENPAALYSTVNKTR
ncbi:B-cell receptor CD22-like [Larimichthys crocea]|uniref:B-cell receptor CD22-like n=1 Tax=Larimichthys crocea TaxID=215358 RepID=UPI000F5FA2A5|nr:B-cell receptor CD22-like [Larimichthys crocea]